MAEVRSGRAATAATPALLVTIALAGPFVAPHAPDEQTDPAAASFLPPGSVRYAVHLRDGRSLLVEELEPTPAGWRGRRLDRALTLSRREVRAVERRRFHLGTDRFGRDVLSRLLAGARPSLAIGGMAALLALALGVAAAVVAGASGPGPAAATLWLGNALLSIPRLFLLLGLAVAVPLGPAGLTVALALTSWMPTARLVGGEIRSGATSDLAAAARACGASRLRILLRHLVPAALPAAATDAALRAGDFILLEAALSFLGAGIQPPHASWGSMVAESTDVLAGAWWLSLFPGLAVLAAVAALSFWADRLRDRLDARARYPPRRRRTPTRPRVADRC
jgi:ABC-type dipeptide/oligopeptide/nickel transport system permease subunit